MFSIMDITVKGLQNEIVQQILGLATLKLLPSPSRAAMERGQVMTSLEKKFPDYEFDSLAFYNPMICPACGYTAEHFLCWKNGERYQLWACKCSDWVSGPWSCPSDYPRFSTKN